MANERVAGVATVTVSPSTLQRRLLFGTPLIACAIFAIPRLLGSIGGKRVGAPPIDKEMMILPELVWIFVAPDSRRAGVGAALIRQVDEELRRRGHQKYLVRTLLEDQGGVWSFYLENGFSNSGPHRIGSSDYQVFTRVINGRGD